MGRNEKNWFSNLLLISILLGWNFYLQMALSTGCEISPELIIMVYYARVFIYIQIWNCTFKESIKFVCNFFHHLVINNSVDSTYCIFEAWSPLFEKKGLTFFRKSLFFTNGGFRFLKKLFNRLLIVVSFLYSRLRKFFCLLKTFNEFSVRFLKYTFSR